MKLHCFRKFVDMFIQTTIFNNFSIQYLKESDLQNALNKINKKVEQNQEI